ncbi:MAG: GAF domain-containing protein [Firmicutes bacterium]|nr:GAF domain-containing protein [Bacillota bacterium]
METDEKIIKLLVDEYGLNPKSLMPIYQIHKANKEPLEKLVIQFKLAKREDVLQAKTRIVGGEPIKLKLDEIDKEVAKTIPQAMAKRYNLICTKKDADGKMIIAMHDPNDSFALEYVQMRTGNEIKPFLVLMTDLEEAWVHVYSEEKKWQHPFFREAPKPVKAVKQIPQKLSIPGLSSKPKNDSISEQQKIRTISEDEDPPKPKSADYEKLLKAYEELKKEREALAILSQSSNALNSVLDEKELIIILLETAAKITHAQGASILLLEAETLYFKEAIGQKSQDLKELRIPLTENSIAGWAALNRTCVAVNNVGEDERHYKGIDDQLDFETRTVACAPLMWGEEVLGVMEAVNKQEGEFTTRDLEYLAILASQASVAIHNTVMMEQFQNFYLEVVEILIDCIESLDQVNKDHCMLVARLAGAMAKQFDITEDDYETLCYAAFLHDIGKIKCSDDKDYSCHAIKGAQMLSNIKVFNSIVPFVKYHHEKFDGTGTPDGLKGEEIPLGARVLCIAEEYIEDRSDYPDKSDDEYLEIFLDRFGTYYDPELKELFINALA